jgi:hypothetical protein
MFKKMMSSLGIQGVTVETHLHNPTLQAVKRFTGKLVLKVVHLIKKSMFVFTIDDHG